MDGKKKEAHTGGTKVMIEGPIRVEAAIADAKGNLPAWLKFPDTAVVATGFRGSFLLTLLRSEDDIWRTTGDRGHRLR